MCVGLSTAAFGYVVDSKLILNMENIKVAEQFYKSE
jgi:hypothetical protein